MRISWLSADEIAAARTALTEGGATYESPFTPAFVPPPEQNPQQLLDWPGITEHVARAERISEVVREQGLEAARERFAGSGIAIEAATIAAAAHEDESLDRARAASPKIRKGPFGPSRSLRERALRTSGERRTGSCAATAGTTSCDRSSG